MHCSLFVVYNEMTDIDTFAADDIYDDLYRFNGADYTDEIDNSDEEEIGAIIHNWLDDFNVKIEKKPIPVNSGAIDACWDVTIPVSTMQKYLQKNIETIAKKSRKIADRTEPISSLEMYELKELIDDRFGAVFFSPEEGSYDSLQEYFCGLVRWASENGKTEVTVHITQVFDYHI